MASSSFATEAILVSHDPRSTAFAGAMNAEFTPASVFLNPAAIYKVEVSAISAGYNVIYDDMSQQHLYFAMPPKVLSIAMGFGVETFDFGAIDTYDKFGVSNGSKSAGRVTKIGFAGGKDLGRIKGGLALSSIISEIVGNTASAFAVDAGIIWLTPIERLNTTLVIKNFGTKLKYVEEETPLPLVSQIGTEYKFIYSGVGSVLAGVAVTYDTHHRAIPLFGIESELLNMLSFRGGYVFTTVPEGGVRAGIGFSASNFKLDYSWSPVDVLGAMHKMAITYRFGGKEFNERKEENDVILIEERAQVIAYKKMTEENVASIERLCKQNHFDNYKNEITSIKSETNPEQAWRISVEVLSSIRDKELADKDQLINNNTVSLVNKPIESTDSIPEASGSVSPIETLSTIKQQGVTLYRDGKYEETITYLNEQRKQFPADADIKNTLSQTYEAYGQKEYKDKNYVHAAALWREGLKLTDAIAYDSIKIKMQYIKTLSDKIFLEGLKKYQADQYKEAAALWRDAIELNPENERASASLRRIPQ